MTPNMASPSSPSSVMTFVEMSSTSRRPTRTSTSAKVAANVAGARARATSRSDSMQDRIKRIMDDPAEWTKFRADMAAGGHVTNAATAMELMKHAAKSQEGSDGKVYGQKTSRLGDDDRDIVESEAVLGDDDDEEEEGSHEEQNIVNKGLRWINQTLSATSMMQEASASQLHVSQLKQSPHRRSVPPRFSFDGTGTRNGNSNSPIDTLAEEPRHGDMAGAGDSAAVDRSIGGNSKRSVARSNSLDAVSQYRRRSSASANAKYNNGIVADRKCDDDDDENMVVGQSSFHLDLRRGLGLEHLGDAAKAVRRGSGSLVGYLSGITADTGIDATGRAALPSSSLASRQRQARRHSVSARPVRRGSSLIMTAVRGLEHEIDAADYLEGGGS
mmetsp:Transcript_28627/g.62350  ORF Transcript_28627/g.62350 Transcript_28627/m.62350 type:complete len:386 (+) Transcript_28627:276-1433(+)